MTVTNIVTDDDHWLCVLLWQASSIMMCIEILCDRQKNEMIIITIYFVNEMMTTLSIVIIGDPDSDLDPVAV